LEAVDPEPQRRLGGEAIDNWVFGSARELGSAEHPMSGSPMSSE